MIANRLLDAAGLSTSNISAQRLALRPTVDQMKSGRIDGLFWSGGLPTPELIFDKKDDLVKVHKAAAAIDRKLATETAPVELHPGAAQALNAD